jgi:hypothetical protein
MTVLDLVQYGAHDFKHGSGRIGLGQEMFDCDAEHFGVSAIGIQPACRDNFDRRVQLQQGADRCGAVHDWHRHISQDNGYLVPLLCINRYGLGSIIRGERPVSKRLQRFARNDEDGGFVIHDEDRFAVSSRQT